MPYLKPGTMTREQEMNLVFEGGKDGKRAQRRDYERKRKDRTAAIINVAGGYDDDAEALRRAVVKRANSETTGRHRIDRNIVGGTIRRMKREAIDLRESLA